MLHQADSEGTTGYEGDFDALVFSLANGVTYCGVATHSDSSPRTPGQRGWHQIQPRLMEAERGFLNETSKRIRNMQHGKSRMYRDQLALRT